MSDESVTYQEKEEAWFEDRQLRRHAGVGSLWALGVGAVISGDFFGWNFGLSAGGFGGMLIATVIATLLYAGICASIAELAAALPHAGGAYSRLGVPRSGRGADSWPDSLRISSTS
jgi:ethanolamine permease